MLEIYEQNFGQVLNKNKTSIFFSHNTLLEVGQMITQIVGVRAITILEKFLGLSAFLGRSKTKPFQNLLGKTW